PFVEYRVASWVMREPVPGRTGRLMAFPFLFAGGLYNSPHSPVLEDGAFLRVLPAGNMEPLSPGGFWMLGDPLVAPRAQGEDVGGAPPSPLGTVLAVVHLQGPAPAAPLAQSLATFPDDLPAALLIHQSGSGRRLPRPAPPLQG